MEVEAVKQEQASLENQIVSFQKQICVLASEVDSLKTKVDHLTYFLLPQFLCLLCKIKDNVCTLVGYFTEG